MGKSSSLVQKPWNIEKIDKRPKLWDLSRPDDGKIRLDIGCGKLPHSGFIGVDKYKNSKVKICCDINSEALPFDDDSVDEILCSHLLEHIENLDFAVSEMHRVLKPGAKMLVIVPFYLSQYAFKDPTHKRFFTEKTFEYFDKSYMEKYSRHPFSFDFKTNKLLLFGSDYNHLEIWAELETKKSEWRKKWKKV